MSSYWFASSFKWFILLNGLMAARVAAAVPSGEANASWGLVVMIGSFEAIIGPILIGFWSDRVASPWGRRRPFLAVGAAFTAIALLMLSGANSLPQIIFAYLLLQISDDFATAPYSALIPDLVPEEQRGRASGVMALLQQIAQVVAAVVGLALGGSPATIFMVIAGVNIACAIITLLTAKEEPGVKREGASRLSIDQWLAPWRVPDFRWVWFTRFLNSVGFYAVLLYLINFFKERVVTFNLFGLNVGDAGKAQIAIALLISIVGGASAIVAGKRSDAIGRKAVVRSAGWVMAGTLLVFAFSTNYTMIFLLAGVFGAGYGAYLSADWALAADILPSKDEFARDMGMWLMSVPLGQTVAGALGQVVDGLNRMGPGIGYTAAFLLAALCFLASTELVRKISGST